MQPDYQVGYDEVSELEEGRGDERGREGEEEEEGREEGDRFGYTTF